MQNITYHSLTDRTKARYYSYSQWAKWNTQFFYKLHFYNQLQAEQHQVNAKQHLAAELLLFKIIHILHPRYHPKIIGHILKNSKRTSAFVFIRLIIMKMKMKMKNKSERCNINRHGHKYSKYKTYLSVMMLVPVKQHLSNIWSSIHEKVKKHWGWLEKSVAYKIKIKKINKSKWIKENVDIDVIARRMVNFGKMCYIFVWYCYFRNFGKEKSQNSRNFWFT